MQIRFHCPNETCVAIIEYEPLEQCGPTMKCPRCGTVHDITITPSMKEKDLVDACAVCGCTELFIRKDFPQKLGLAVVILFGAAAIYCFTFNVLLAWGVLAAAVLVDVLIYGFIGKLTTCYACRAEYRKCGLNPAHEGFDLATSEKY